MDFSKFQEILKKQMEGAQIKPGTLPGSAPGAPKNFDKCPGWKCQNAGDTCSSGPGYICKNEANPQKGCHNPPCWHKKDGQGKEWQDMQMQQQNNKLKNELKQKENDLKKIKERNEHLEKVEIPKLKRLGKNIYAKDATDRKLLFKQIQKLQKSRKDLKDKIALLNSNQDRHIEDSRLTGFSNENKLKSLDSDLSILRRKLVYSYEWDKVHNAKVYLLGNLVFYMSLGVAIYFIYLFIFKKA